MTIREYGSRTAATNFLRGKGIAAADFAKFITVKSDKVYVNDALIGKKADPVKEVVTRSGAAEAVEKVKLPLETNVVVIGTDLKGHLSVSAAETTPVTKRAAKKPVKADAKTGKAKPAVKKPQAAKPAAKKGGLIPVSQFCLAMFKTGSSNEEVWAQLQKVYGLDEDKAHYPSWYRSHFRRKGQLPAASVVAKGGK